MTQSATCCECGGGIPSDARTMGLCPRCLLSRVIETGSKPGPSAWVPFIAPEPAELQRELPQLDVLGLIGQGGMGAVYKARQRSLDRLVALKVFPRGQSDDPSFAERFAREARVLASLSHPNIITAHEFGQSESCYYLLMELVSGGSLRQAISADRIPQERALAITVQICEALEYAHGRGVIHRDIKPENILLDDAGRTRVADFGLAKLMQADPSALSLTSPEHRLGTPFYMAPEQREPGAPIDARADIYSLGVVLYEMLTAQVPVGRFAAPSEVAKVEPWLDRVVLRCLEFDPGRRYRTVAELRGELLIRPNRRRRAVLIAVGGVAIAAALAIATSAWWMHRPRKIAPIVSAEPTTQVAQASLTPHIDDKPAETIREPAKAPQQPPPEQPKPQANPPKNPPPNPSRVFPFVDRTITAWQSRPSWRPSFLPFPRGVEPEKRTPPPEAKLPPKPPSPALVNSLLDKLKSPDAAVRKDAITLLGELRAEKAAEPLAKMIVSDRPFAGDALRSIGPAAEKAVLAQLDSEDHWMRFESAKVLAFIGTSESLPRLRSLLNDPNGVVRMAAETAISEIQKRTVAK